MEKFTFTRRNITVITSYLLFTAIFFILGLLIGFKNGDDPIIKEVSSVTQNIPEFTPVPFTTPSPSHYRVILEDGKLRLYIDENGVSRLVSQEEISEDFSSLSIEEHVDSYIEEGLSKKDAIKKCAEDRNISKRDVYNIVMKKD